MNRTLCFLSLAVPFALAAAPAPQIGSVTNCLNVIPHEPMVVYEVTGGTFAGPTDMSFVMYTDGSLRLSSTTANEGLGFAKTASINSELADQVLAELVANGAAKLCDSTISVTDTPLSTLTIFLGTTQAAAHSHSWWIANAADARSAALLDGVIHDAFGTF